MSGLVFRLCISPCPCAAGGGKRWAQTWSGRNSALKSAHTGCALGERSRSSAECPGLASTPQPWSAETPVAGAGPWLVVGVALGEVSGGQQGTAAGDVSWAAALAVVMSKLFSWSGYRSQTSCKYSLPENRIETAFGHLLSFIRPLLF